MNIYPTGLLILQQAIGKDVQGFKVGERVVAE